MDLETVETIRFSHYPSNVRDEWGHSHLGEPHETIGAITRVVDGVPDGYCIGDDWCFVEANRVS